MKYAVYVEGKAEMLFVADLLSKYSNYDRQMLSAPTFGHLRNIPVPQIPQKDTDYLLLSAKSPCCR